MRYYSRYRVENDREYSKVKWYVFDSFYNYRLILMLAGMVLVLNTELIFGDKLTANNYLKPILMA